MTLITNHVRIARTSLLLGLLAAVTVSTPGEARAQPPDSLRGPPPTDVAGVVAEIRSGEAAGLRAFLEQRRGARTEAELQAVSDSVVAIMRTASGDRINVYGVVEGIAFAITTERGTPFAGGVDLLFRIYDALDVGMNRSGVLFLLSRVAPPGRLLPLLAEALETPGSQSVGAVRLLAEEMGPPGIAVLQDAYCADRLTSPARQRLRGYIWSGVIDEECRSSDR